MARPISAKDKIPDAPVQAPALAPELNVQPGLLQEGELSLKERP